MQRSSGLLVVALGFAACATPGATGPEPTGGPGGDPGGDPGTGTIADPAQPTSLVMADLQPGWLVTTTRLVDGSDPIDTTVVSDGSPITLDSPAGGRVFATITDGDGALISTRTMRTPCSLAHSHQRRVPSEYRTIQAAVDAARPGDTVAVAPGHYTEAIVMRPGVCLLGSGARDTVLDARGQAISLVDLSGAPGSVVAGFTFRGVTMAAGCADRDPFTCSGNWYRAGVFASGEGYGAEGDTGDRWNGPSQLSPALIINNVFADNDIGVMINFHGIGIVRNNVFVGNRSALVANHFQDHSLVANNVFVGNRELAIGNQAAFLDILANVIVGSDVGIRFAYVQTGAIRCNVFFGNAADQADDALVPPRFTIGKDGNIGSDPQLVAPSTALAADAGGGDYHLSPGSPAHDAGCSPHGFEPDGNPYDIGAYGGPLASWVTL